MRVLGLIGGTGWPSTRDYYELLNQAVQHRKGGLSGVELRLWSFDFQRLLEQTEGNATALTIAFTEAGKVLQAAGAEVLAISSATGHLFVHQLRNGAIPLVGLPGACALVLSELMVKRVLIIGTKMAIHGGVFDPAFEANSIEVVRLSLDLQEALDSAIFDELERAMPSEKCAFVIKAIDEFCQLHTIEHVLLGCTELRPKLFIDAQFNPTITLHDSTTIHVNQIVDFLLTSS
jgi:aspartate racemase